MPVLLANPRRRVFSCQGPFYLYILCLFQTIVAWKMKPPEKKPLVRRDDPNQFTSRIHKGAGKKRIEPIKALNEFEEIDSFC